MHTSLKYQRGITKRGDFRHEMVMSGTDHKESAQKLIDAYRIHYNFIRGHSGIGKTPAEQAGIKLDLVRIKLKTLSS